ncbi:ABC transporter permease subunit [Methylocystis sp. MJC1]|jgi:putrescine transport system permease protein|uniref:ABC transporter permease n=1 Tax=Methylocystis sp. MJC1 TaxID=2654282 RepID=UPI0013EC8352|nr:ABC transporter permease subunit [Methylocystis sp. MJC1]KAF2989388.1 Inner membrane ABC transporter permease protein YdcV [Methylocystis sp. MJC1]MBU6526863.1 ABC transporter permease subunit [Methylocystis sp. MJC1]UZX13301.1 ABC transporter permease subunit [Methylocystis sp. MJC1]
MSNIFRIGVLIAGFVFLYAPIAILAAMSFNASRLVSVWGGFSTKWYAALLENEPLIESTKISLAAAVLSAVIATFLGLLAAVALARFGAFRSRMLFFGAVHAPLVLPEVVLGLALLSCFVALGIGRGFATLVIGHVTLTMCFTTVALLSALRSCDLALEEAAMDLGATPLQAFALVALPQIAPAMASAFLLAFTLSLDDLVIASFATGPGATTLPMRIFSQVRLGVSPQINAISTLLLGLVALALGGSALVMQAGKRRGL